MMDDMSKLFKTILFGHEMLLRGMSNLGKVQMHNEGMRGAGISSMKIAREIKVSRASVYRVPGDVAGSAK